MVIVGIARFVAACAAAAATAVATAGTTGTTGPPPFDDSPLPAPVSVSAPVLRRVVPDAPSGYVPAGSQCPSDRPVIRDGTALSRRELAWIPLRRNQTVAPLREFFARAAIPDFDSDAYLADAESDPTALPNVGLAFSGGGYRAMLNGGGALAAFDSRTAGATGRGHLGGLLQGATYVSALSGGGWLVGSVFLNNFTAVQQIRDDGRIWRLDNSILEGPEDVGLLDYYDAVFGAVGDKDAAGFQSSITDYWGRMLSFQLIDDPSNTGGADYTFSSIGDDQDFSQGRWPMPILVADGRYPNEILVSTNTTVYEFNPWEFGSFDPTLRGFAPLRYAGSAFSAGSLPENASCVRGFDNAGFVMGTSSSLFNQLILYLNSDSDLVPQGVPDFATSAIAGVLESLGDANNDIADWSPNPFFGYNPDVNLNAAETRLTLVDGGENLENVPYSPLVRADRAVDVIFSVDSSADTDFGWPNGTSVVATRQRAADPISDGSLFPDAPPDTNTFVNLGINARPVFFGCDVSQAGAGTNSSGNGNSTTDVPPPPPLVVYIPNHPYVFFSNFSTFTMTYTNEDRNAMLQNGYEVATQANSTRDPDWQVCVACAALKRSWQRTGTAEPAMCTDCFARYCWNGTVDSSEPAAFDPQMVGTTIATESAAAPAMAAAAGCALWTGVVVWIVVTMVVL